MVMPAAEAGLQHGTLVMQPADSSLQSKEVPLETFFHKIVMIRNNLRVLEQKVNASDKLSDADKFALQQYTIRCYGAYHVQHPVQKQGRPVPNQRLGSAASSFNRDGDSRQIRRGV